MPIILQPTKRAIFANNSIFYIIKIITIGILIYHADGAEEIIYANQALLRIFQCNSIQEFRELTGNSFRGVVHPQDLAKVEPSITSKRRKCSWLINLRSLSYSSIRLCNFFSFCDM